MHSQSGIFRKILSVSYLLALIVCFPSFSITSFHPTQPMETLQRISNKEVIRDFYEKVLNQRKLERMNEYVSENYVSATGEKGIDMFQKPLMALLKAFPDAQWTINEMLVDGDKVMVMQKITGTHTQTFQNIDPTHKTVANTGVAVYTLKNSKIVSHWIQTDRLSFLQQLNVIPVDLNPSTASKESTASVYFIDKFQVPAAAVPEFTQRMGYNRSFIRTLPGFIRDAVYTQTDTDGRLSIVTVAVWENKDALNRAKDAVLAEYQRIGFNPAEFYEKLHIVLDRGIYQQLPE